MFNPQITDFLAGLGYKPGDAIHMRLLPAKQFNPELPEHRAMFKQCAYQKERKDEAGHITKEWLKSQKNLRLQGGKLVWQCRAGDKPIKCSDPMKWLEQQSKLGFCPYIVVNPGGQNKSEITKARVIFWEHDALDKVTQIERFMEYADRWGGGMAVETRSSIHCYIRLDQELAPNLIQPTLHRIIALMGSDLSVNDECRLMRIPSFDHIKMVKTDGVWKAERCPITLLHSWDGSFASWEQIDRELPIEEPKPVKTTTKPTSLSTCADDDLATILERDILPRLSAEQIFNWSGHDFKEEADGKLKGNCPWHDSQSGTSFWVTKSQDGVTYSGACPTCTKNEKLNPIAYRYALQKGGPSGQPNGKDFVEVVKELAADAGVQLPVFKPAIGDGTAPQSERLWSCLESHNNQLGEWIRVKEEDGEITTFWGPKTNFDLKVSKILEDRTGGGFEFEVTWKERSIVRTRRALVKTHETLTIKDFQTALTRGLGTHVTAKLKPGELADLIQNRKEEYSRNGGVVYRLADRTGQQDDGTWIFEDVQLKADGTPTTEQESRWMFNQSLGELENIPSPAIAPQNPEAIKTLVKALQAFYDPKAMPYALLTIGFAVMGLHRQEIMKHVGEVASLAIYGERGGGKSAVQAAAASLYGLHTWKMSDVSVSMFGEYAKSLGSLPIQWDDPIRQGTYAKADEEKVNTALWKLFTGLGRAVRGNAQAPNTVVCVSTNRTLGAGNAAIASRLISFIFPVHPVTRSAGSALKVAMNGASGGLSQILGISYDVQAIEAHGHQLLEHLSEADSRNANALATLAYFTQKFCELADVDFDALTFIKTDICPQTNEQGAGKDSLTDFLEKLAIFRSEGGAGDWNLTECRSRDGSKYLAVHLSSLWETFEGRFKPNYGQSLIAQLAEDAGGAKKQKRYFVASRDNAIAYHRALNAWEMGIAGSEKPMEPKRDHQASAIIIPRSVAEKAGFFPTSGDHEEPIATPPQPELTLTTAAAPTPEPIEVRQLETTTAVTAPTQPDLGAWESNEPIPWNQKDLADARSTIKADPNSVETFKPMIPRSQWKQAGIAESELCAA